MTDHDQRWKTLLREFFEDFIRLFFPAWANLLDFSRIEWLDKEVFPSPPEGQRRMLDLVARLGLTAEGRADAAWAGENPAEELLALVHVEVESSNSAASIHRRMPRYYFHLREAHGAAVLPVVLFLRVGWEGVGAREYMERFGPLETLRFRYLYAGLPALDGVQYLEGGNPLGVAMSALMRVPRDRRAWFKVEALQRLAQCDKDDLRRYLLAECVDAYLPLTDDQEQQEFQTLLATSEYEEAKTMTAPTIFEAGMERGMEKGQRALLLAILEDRFGPLGEAARQRVEALSASEVFELGRKAHRAQSLAELGLEP